MTKDELRISPDLALPVGAVTETFGILAKRGSGKSYAAAVLAEEMLKAHLQVVIIDPLDVLWGLRSSADGEHKGLPIVVLGGSHGDIPLVATSGQLLADVVVEQGMSCVLSLRHLSKNEQRRFVTDFCERLYHRKGEEQYRQPLHLIIDEADSYCPQRVFSGQERMVGAIDDLVRRGRASGIGVTLITQRAAVIAKDVLTQIETLIVLRTISPQDRKAMESWIEAHDVHGQRQAFMDSLASLPIGTAWFWSPGWLDTFKRIEIRRRETFDSSATPKIGETVRAPKQLADVDLEVLRTRIASTIEKAKADDPRELRRRIAELERGLKTRPTEHRIETVTERVEVPVLANGQLEGFQSAIASLVDVGSQLLSLGQELQETVARATAAPAPVPRPVPTPRVVAPKPETRRPDFPSVTSDVQLNKGQRVLLETLARRHPATATITQLGTLSGYSTKSSSFQQNLREIVRAGLVQQQGRELTITDAGLQAVGAETLRPRSPQELLDMWRQALTTGERAILDLLVDVYPAGLSRGEISERTGYSTTSSSFQQNLRDLRKNGLAEEHDGLLRASETLFLETA